MYTYSDFTNTVGNKDYIDSNGNKYEYVSGSFAKAPLYYSNDNLELESHRQYHTIITNKNETITLIIDFYPDTHTITLSYSKIDGDIIEIGSYDSSFAINALNRILTDKQIIPKKINGTFEKYSEEYNQANFIPSSYHEYREKLSVNDGVYNYINGFLYKEGTFSDLLTGEQKKIDRLVVSTLFSEHDRHGAITTFVKIPVYYNNVLTYYWGSYSELGLFSDIYEDATGNVYWREQFYPHKFYPDKDSFKKWYIQQTVSKTEAARIHSLGEEVPNPYTDDELDQAFEDFKKNNGIDKKQYDNYNVIQPSITYNTKPVIEFSILSLDDYLLFKEKINNYYDNYNKNKGIIKESITTHFEDKSIDRFGNEYISTTTVEPFFLKKYTIIDSEKKEYIFNSIDISYKNKIIGSVFFDDVNGFYLKVGDSTLDYFITKKELDVYQNLLLPSDIYDGYYIPESDTIVLNVTSSTLKAKFIDPTMSGYYIPLGIFSKSFYPAWLYSCNGVSDWVVYDNSKHILSAIYSVYSFVYNNGYLKLQNYKSMLPDFCASIVIMDFNEFLIHQNEPLPYDKKVSRNDIEYFATKRRNDFISTRLDYGDIKDLDGNWNSYTNAGYDEPKNVSFGFFPGYIEYAVKNKKVFVHGIYSSIFNNIEGYISTFIELYETIESLKEL